MKTLDTPQLGPIHTLTEAEAATRIDLGENAQLCSGYRKLNRGAVTLRTWYVQGDRGVVNFADDTANFLGACERFLAANGYKPAGNMPPAIFEYSR